jgi:4-amino-4-deoxy-L-arabinose transferase-like glycosyltransferase
VTKLGEASGASIPVDGAPDSDAERSQRWFTWALAGVALVGLAIRVAFVLLSRQHIKFGGDAYFYHAGANLLADGEGFINPFFLPRHLQAADHPPLYMVYLSAFSVLGMRSTLWHLLWSCVLGTGTVVLVGLLGRSVAGARAGIIAAVLAAAYPNLWIPDGGLLAETMAMFVVALVLLLAYWYWQQPSWLRLAAVGAASGAAALSRSELILFIPLLVLPLALLRGGDAWRPRLLALGAGVLAGLIVVGPWVGFNLTRFKEPETLSTQFGPTLATANCKSIYYGDFLSYYDFRCAVPIEKKSIPANYDESQQDAVYRHAAIDYISKHRGRVPAVIAARIGAVFGVYKPARQITIDSFIEGRGSVPAHWGMYTFYVLGLLSIAGAVVLRRRRSVPLFPLLVPPVIVLLTVISLYTSTRFRTPAEVSIVVLAAVALDGWWNALAARRRSSTAQPADS